VRQAFDELDGAGRFLLVKLIGGGFRVGVSKLLVQRALAEHAGIDAKLVAQRMMGYTEARATPSAARFEQLVTREHTPALDAGQPYPFFLAHALQAAPETLGPPADWLVEWKYDGIRAQLVKRAGQVWIWSRGEELVTERFPEIVAAAQGLPDGTVLDGEVLVWREGEDHPAPFNLLQQRIGRKTLNKRVLADAPVRFLAYDLLEAGASDRRSEPQHVRRVLLEALLDGQRLQVSPTVAAPDWPAYAELRGQSRARGVEGVMLKQREARYGSGRTKVDGTWWKWKVDPLSVDCVLIYAQAGHGRRASVYTDYTFAVWSRTPADAAEAQAVIDAIARREPVQPEGLQLVAFAKAYSGLTDEEFAAVDREIRAHTLEKFGPVRSVRPTLVFELGFEGINLSPRHKSGLAVRFPRMLRIRHDKPLHEADTLDTLRALMHRA
jgi:DNA ligase-1